MTHLDAMKPHMKEEAYSVSCFCLKTGCRPGEAIKLAATCVLKNKLLIQHDKRQRHDRKPRLESWYWKELDEEGLRFAKLCEERAAQRDAGKPAKQSTHLFGGLTQAQYGRAFRQARDKAGLPEFVGLIVPHCGRHAFCNSVKRAVLSDELGDLLQMTPKTFQRYAKLQSEREAAIMQHQLRRDLDEPDAEGEGIREALEEVAKQRAEEAEKRKAELAERKAEKAARAAEAAECKAKAAPAPRAKPAPKAAKKKAAARAVTAAKAAGKKSRK
mmetsp:Transcript_51491/g.158672  ORF Transcript_51491/g.158672 Transcript_51491/m.158672 type:complete len:272 (-) Transcript_51491:66-881(-)